MVRRSKPTIKADFYGSLCAFLCNIRPKLYTWYSTQRTINKSSRGHRERGRRLRIQPGKATESKTETRRFIKERFTLGVRLFVEIRENSTAPSTVGKKVKFNTVRKVCTRFSFTETTGLGPTE